MWGEVLAEPARAGTWAHEVDALRDDDSTIEVARLRYPGIPDAVLEHIYSERDRRASLVVTKSEFGAPASTH